MEHLIQVNINFNGKHDVLKNNIEEYESEENNKTCKIEEVLHDKINGMEHYINSLKSQIKEYEIDQTYVSDFQRAEIYSGVDRNKKGFKVPRGEEDENPGFHQKITAHRLSKNQQLPK